MSAVVGYNGTPAERLARRSAPGPNGCVEWTGATHLGYGWIYVGGRKIGAHRLAWELRNGPIPDSLQIDHLCRNRACVNPAHLEPVTQRENLMRGETIVARQAAQTHCKRGHEFVPENIEWQGSKRSCRECRRQLKRANRRAAQ